MDTILRDISEHALEELVSYLKTAERLPVNLHRLQQILGSKYAKRLYDYIQDLELKHWEIKQLVLLFSELLAEKKATSTEKQDVDLVLSCPSDSNIDFRTTSSVVHNFLNDASETVLLVGYVITNGKRIFHQLSENMSTNKDLKVKFILNVPKPPNDYITESIAVKSFYEKFIEKQWPGKIPPEIYYDSRIFGGGSSIVSLHSKCLIIDNAKALISSANFTDAGHFRNIETGVLIMHPDKIMKLSNFFENLISDKVFKKMNS